MEREVPGAAGAGGAGGGGGGRRRERGVHGPVRAAGGGAAGALLPGGGRQPPAGPRGRRDLRHRDERAAGRAALPLPRPHDRAPCRPPCPPPGLPPAAGLPELRAAGCADPAAPALPRTGAGGCGRGPAGVAAAVPGVGPAPAPPGLPWRPCPGRHPRQGDSGPVCSARGQPGDGTVAQSPPDIASVGMWGGTRAPWESGPMDPSRKLPPVRGPHWSNGGVLSMDTWVFSPGLGVRAEGSQCLDFSSSRRGVEAGGARADPLPPQEVLERIHEALRAEYECRRQVMVTRFAVTLQSFQWAERAKEHGVALPDVLTSLRRVGAEPSAVTLARLLAVRADASRLVPTSAGAARLRTSCSINKVLMGSVPDRGGRPGELEAPMPSWEPRRQGGGGGARRGRKGKKKIKPLEQPHAASSGELESGGKGQSPPVPGGATEGQGS